ncbi:MAG: DUF4011 domain-containing protein [Bacteroidales bacterium]|nr:DUF4011 domain-containing protein [Bacteroidales bacterium]
MRITLKIDHAELMSFSRMQNKIHAIRSIIVRNDSEEELHNLSLRLGFDPDFAHAGTIQIGSLPSKGKVVLSDVNVTLSSKYFSNLTEPATGSVKIEILREEEILHSESFSMDLLPYDHWEGLRNMPELTASFVLPNHPAVKKILHGASRHLGQISQSPQIDGYQSADPGRTLQQIEAIYLAVRDEGISCAGVPASFHDDGPRTRLPEEILSTRLATCLDTTLLFAACLEAASINPILVFVPGHAFVGAWLNKESSPYAVNDDQTTLTKLSADGINDIAMFETTCAASGHSESFDQAMKLSALKLSSPDEFICFIDVAASRKLGIKPLPLRIKTPQGYEIQAQEAEQVNPSDRTLESKDEINLDSPVKIGKEGLWERKLLDLTLRNNLISVHTHASCLQLMCPEPERVGAMIENGRALSIWGSPDPAWIGPMLRKGIVAQLCEPDMMWNYCREEAKDCRLHSFIGPNDTEDRVVALRKAAKSTMEESGANTLFLSIGALRWYDEEGKGPYVAPVLLYPVEFSGLKNTLVETGEEPIINMTLMEMLRQRFSLNIPGLDPLPQKDGQVDVRKVLNTLRLAVRDRGGWDVDELMFVGNFMFGKFIIWNDIHTHSQMLRESPLVSSFIDNRLHVRDIGAIAQDEDLDKVCPSASVLTPIGADSSQLKAIAEAVGGRSFVMHGPPGTGKSQTITNIIANALYHGKRVLFVSEKKAALEVVQSRLESLGLDPFCLELHSNKTRKSVVMRKLEATLAILDNKPREGFEELAQRNDAYRKELDSHVQALHKVYPSGMSLYDCMSKYMSMDKSIAERPLPRPVIVSMNGSTIKDMEDDIQDYITAIRHTGIDSGCGLVDMPLIAWGNECEDQLRVALEKVAASSGIRLWFAQRRLEKLFDAPIGVGIHPDKIALVKRKAIRWNDNLHEGRRYAIYSRYRAKLRARGLSIIVDSYEKGSLPPEQMMDFFHKSLYHSYAEYILAKEERLNLFCGELFESRIEKFREFNKEFAEASRQAIIDAATARLRSATGAEHLNPELTTLTRAIRNGCRGISLRNLFEKIPSLLPKVCPCMLMSPLSVSQYLRAAGGQFDLVIFDEASQMPTCESVSSLARANAAVIVGDPEQLPPTSFFQSNFFDEENADKEDLDSILDDAIGINLPSNHLRWHYRSRHESLIAFSNANYYGNSLLTFPSMDDLRSAVHFQKVEGVYDRGRTRQNIIEAEAVVEDIKRRLSDPVLKNQTIGVVTFNVTQQAAIESRLEDMLRRYSMLKKAANELSEPIFVKNLENVQGDERDVILFSVGYALDAKGRLPMNFGPLNQAGGWHRLNVAVSRARVEMKIFSSIMPEDIPSAGLSRGVSDLRMFLQYAISGRSCLESKTTGSSAAQDLFVEQIARKLRREGHTVNTSVGSSDFKVDLAIVDPQDPGRYVKGIIVDGPGYASAKTASDREITRMSVLEGLGWKIERTWILDYYK